MDNQNIQESTNVTDIMLPMDVESRIIQAKQGRVALNKLFTQVLEQGVDFDRVPGTDKPTLLKPGGELLCQVFKLAPGKPEMIFANEDFEKGIFSYTVGIPIVSRESGDMVAYGMGAANSQEIKYKYRYVKQDGTNGKEKVLNPEPADSQNTLIKMASKRAFVDGVLKATGASRMFTQDVEEMPWLKEEKASSKQVDYIKKLMGGATAENLAEAAKLIERDLKDWSEIGRSEASALIEKLKSAEFPGQQGDSGKSGSRGKGTQQQSYACADCGASITTAEYKYSIERNGVGLCRTCQKTHGQQQESEEKLPWENK